MSRRLVFAMLVIFCLCFGPTSPTSAQVLGSTHGAGRFFHQSDDG